MQWMLVAGLISLWASIDNSPQVIETARRLVESLLSNAEYYHVAGDPLAALNETARGPLAQYRHEFLHPALRFERSLLPDKRAAMRGVPIDSVLVFARSTLEQIDARPQPALAGALLDGYRADLAKLDAWREESGLATTATLGDVQDRLGSRITVPGTDLTIQLDRCLSWLALAIVGLQLYLTSLLATLCDADDQEPVHVDRSWVLLHRAPLGPVLTWLTILAPSVIWIWQQIVAPLGETGVAPDLSTLMLAVAVSIATGMSLYETRRVRRRFLSRAAEHTEPQLADMQAVSAERRAA